MILYDNALSGAQVVYILDQVRALESEMFLRIQKQGLDVTPRILIVSLFTLPNLQLINWVYAECVFLNCKSSCLR